MENFRLMQSIVPNEIRYFHGMCEDLGIELESCNGNADAFYDNDGRCKVCTLPINRHSIPASIVARWEQ